MLPCSWVSAAVPTHVVFQNGRSAPISALTLQGDKLVVTAAVDGFLPGQAFPLTIADHVYGIKPTTLNQAIALLLTGKSSEALKLLEPIVAEHRITAKIAGNFWLEAARAALVAYAVEGNAAKCTEIGKEISDATPAQGIDPFVSLGKALMMPTTTNVADKEVAFRDLTTGNLPANVAAYASIYRGNVLKEAKRNAEALEAYLMVPCLYPTGGLILNGFAELNASELLVAINRREESIALLNSSVRNSADTLLAVEANKRLESLK
jgi:hypothetical protein